MKKPTIKSLRNKADRLMQEAGKAKYADCEICGNPISCMHHFFPKSMSSRLRYDWDNLIPICKGCHFTHHNGNPVPHAVVIKKRGQKWYDRLCKKKQEIVKTDRNFYEKAIKELKKCTL